MGGKHYFERFMVSMQGHATEEQIQNYFASQCLTDDLMAVQLLDDTEAELQKFTVDPKYGPVADFVYFVNEPKSTN